MIKTKQVTNQDLFKIALEGNNLNAAIHLLKNFDDIDVNHKDNDGWMPLLFAAQYGDAAMVDALFAVGAEVNVKDNNGFTPLMLAAQYGDAARVDALLAAGAEVNVKDNNGFTPLMLAARYGDAAMVDALLAKGAEVNIKDNNGFTPLMLAAAFGDAAGVQALLAAGAEVNVKDNTGWTPLRPAAQYGDAAMVDAMLAAGAEVNVKDNYGWTPLMSAAQYGDAAMVNAMLAKGAEVNVKDNDYGRTPLMLAAALGDAARVQALLAAGAEVNVKDNQGRTPLRIAAWHGDAAEVQALLAKGAEVNVKDNDGLTPLMVAAEYGDAARVQALLDAGAEVNVKDNYGLTPLMLAARYGDTARVQALLAAGAEVVLHDAFYGAPSIGVLFQKDTETRLDVYLRTPFCIQLINNNSLYSQLLRLKNKNGTRFTDTSNGHSLKAVYNLNSHLKKYKKIGLGLVTSKQKIQACIDTAKQFDTPYLKLYSEFINSPEGKEIMSDAAVELFNSHYFSSAAPQEYQQTYKAGYEPSAPAKEDVDVVEHPDVSPIGLAYVPPSEGENSYIVPPAYADAVTPGGDEVASHAVQFDYVPPAQNSEDSLEETDEDKAQQPQRRKKSVRASSDSADLPAVEALPADYNNAWDLDYLVTSGDKSEEVVVEENPETDLQVMGPATLMSRLGVLSVPQAPLPAQEALPPLNNDERKLEPA